MTRLPAAAVDAIRAALDDTRRQLDRAREAAAHADSAARIARTHLDRLTTAETELAHTLARHQATPSPDTAARTLTNPTSTAEEPPSPVLAGTVLAVDILAAGIARPLTVTAAHDLADRARAVAGPNATPAQVIATARRLAGES